MCLLFFFKLKLRHVIFIYSILLLFIYLFINYVLVQTKIVILYYFARQSINKYLLYFVTNIYL